MQNEETDFLPPEKHGGPRQAKGCCLLSVTVFLILFALAVASIVGQTIGFEKNIQLILVNDGSPDNSEEICLRYRGRYPNNVVYIKQENAGVSAARNRGLQEVRGEIVNFIDSDDKWELDAFEKVDAFWKEHAAEIDVATTSIQLFEAVEKPHITNYRMENGTRVADLLTHAEASCIVLQVASSFFKASALKNIRFVDSLIYGEDSMFVNTVLLKKMKVGFVAEANYFYRRRESNTSAVQTIKQTPYYFIDCLRDYHLALIRLALEKYRCVPEYIQNVVYYDLCWRFKEPAYLYLSEEEMGLFQKMARQVMAYIDDTVILKNKLHKTFPHKMLAIDIKYGTDNAMQHSMYDKGRKMILFQGLPMFDFKRNKFLLYINFCKVEKNTLRVEGIVAKWLFRVTNQKVRFFFSLNGEIVEPKLRRYAHSVIETCFSSEEKFYRFQVDYPLPDPATVEEELRIYPFVTFGKSRAKLGMNYGKFTVSANNFSPGYLMYRDYVMQCYRTVIKLRPIDPKQSRRLLHWKLEKDCIRWLRQNDLKELADLRTRVMLHKLFSRDKRKIWIISDRVENAGDNGEIFFKYVNQVIAKQGKKANIRPIFAISKNAACVERLKKEGEVIFFESKQYPLYFLLADKIISSGASDFTANPFGLDRKYLYDLFKFKYYYLQHGVACADLSVWLQRFNKNIDMIFASSERERDSFVSGTYYYNRKQVALTGQARFDELYDAKEKQILILPTWRKSIRESYDENTTSIYFPGFRKTAYFQYYNGLINHPRLLDAMRRLGYKGLFCMHPIHMKQTVDFEANDVFRVNEGYINYNDVFARSALMVTDYSSVLFDFAYLRKPVVYTQFDKEDFFAGQIYDEGYFSYENDGLGPVCYDMESTVDAIIAAMERDCENEEKYLARLDRFFAFSDRDNSKRIYEAILKSDK